MEYFDFKAMWEEFLAKDENELTEIERLRKQVYGDIYQNLCKDIDGKIPKNIAETLLEEFNDPNYILFVHKTGKVSKEEVFENGLKILSGNNIEKTATPYASYSLNGKTDFFRDIATTYGYKNSKRAIILKIPVTSFFDYEPGKSKPILINTEEIAEDAGAIIQGETQKILLPEYIFGSVELDGKKISSFAKNPNYKENHNHSNAELVCANGLIENYICAHGEYHDDITVSKLIAEENNQYMKEHSREEKEIKQYSKKEMLFSKFNQMVEKIKNFFAKDKVKEENSQDVDRK